MLKFRRASALAAAAWLVAATVSCGGGGGGGGGGIAFPIGAAPAPAPAPGAAPAPAPAPSAAPAPAPAPAPAIVQLPSRESLIARARKYELDTPYMPPPGTALEHQASGFAKTMCSAVFITGLDPALAAESVGYFVAPYAARQSMQAPVVDRDRKEVHVTIAGGATMVARYYGSQGCVTLPAGSDNVYFAPQSVTSSLPDPATQPWPMGDVLPTEPVAGIDTAKVQQAVAAAFEPASAYTAAFIVTYKGRIVGERYRPGITASTPLESWSMGKSVTATLMGILVRQGVYRLDQPAPIPEWQTAGDKRQEIRIADLMHMSSGLRIKAPDDPDFDPNGTYPDHIYYYTGRIDAFNYAATRPQQWPTDTIGRYRNTDPVLANYLIRLAVEQRGESYLSFPQRELFDKIGIRSMVIETDPYGNFLTQGYDFMAARDWARLGNLYLQDGVWNGERILPEGFVDFVRTPAPAWVADQRPIYGGFFWLNRAGTWAVPTTAYYMLGAGGQLVLIIPSHDLVVVRMGFDKGEPQVGQSMRQALGLLMQAVAAR